MLRKHLLPILCALISLPVLAQLPDNPIGINPPGLKWQQIRTDRVQVIFPSGLDSAGQRVANLVHYLWDHHHGSIGDKMIPITILLQNQTVISNGFVTPGPFRSEFYTTSPQFNEPSNWLDLLAIHEYRHVMQFGNTRQGITGLVRSVLGSWPWGGMFGLALPRWYFEGDATGTETALTRTGRGRLPAFDMEYRSLAQSGIHYSYEKAGAGSFRDFVPNWYPLGYYMTTYARRHYGPQIWTGVVSDAVRFRGLFFPFSKALQRRTGLSTPKLYEATYRELDSLWRDGTYAETRGASPGQSVNRAPKRTVTDYNNPHFLADGRVVAIRRGYDRIPAFVAIDSSGKEEKLALPGIIFSQEEATLSLQDNRLCWAELGFDPRWSNRTYSIIRTYSLTSGEQRKVSSRTRLFSPALSPDGRYIAAVEAGEDLRYRVVVLDAGSGERLQELPNTGGFFYAYPRWTADAKSIVAVANRDEAARLHLIDVASGLVRELTPPTQHQLSHPFPQGDYVFYSAAYTGINNIFAARLSDGAIFQLTDVPTGAFQPSVSADGQQLLYSEFTVKGYDIRRAALGQPGSWRRADPPAIPFGINYFEPLVAQEGGGSIIGKAPRQAFEVRKFNKWSGIIQPHSLLPYVEHPIYGLQVLSDNKFSTLSASAGAFYNVNEREWSYDAALSYAELFPVINGRFRLANRSGLFYNFAPLTDTSIIQTSYVEEWAENQAGAGVSIPLNLTTGNAITRLSLRADYNYLTLNTAGGFDRPENRRDTLRVRNLRDVSSFFRIPTSDGHLNALDLGFTFFSYRRQALQHIYPRLGLVTSLRYRGTFSGGPLQANNLLGRADLYLPGLGRNHSLFFNLMYQRQDLLDNYRFSDLFYYSRGYEGQPGDKYYRAGINYSLPLAYPDWALGPIAFVKRIKANAFFDYTRVRIDAPFNRERTLRSAGLELSFDFRLLRLLEVDAGVRYSYLLDERYSPNGSPHQFDFLLISITD